MSSEFLTTDIDNLFHIGFFALGALVIKVSILRFANTRTKIGRNMLALGAALVIQNACEFLGYFVYSHNLELTYRIVDGYMIATYYVFAFIVIFSVDLITDKYSSPLHWGMLMLATILTGLHLSGHLVNGYHFNGYSLVRNPAEYYRVVELYIVLCATVGLVLPAGCYLTSRNRERQLLVALSGLSLYCAGAIFIVICMAYGIEISSAIFGPIASTLFLLVVLCSSRRELFIRIEGELLARLKIIKLAAFDFDKNDLAAHMDALEEILMGLAISRANGNKAEAARLLGVSRSTVSVKCKRHGLSQEKP